MAKMKLNYLESVTHIEYSIYSIYLSHGRCDHSRSIPPDLAKPLLFKSQNLFTEGESDPAHSAKSLSYPPATSFDLNR